MKLSPFAPLLDEVGAMDEVTLAPDGSSSRASGSGCHKNGVQAEYD